MSDGRAVGSKVRASRTPLQGTASIDQWLIADVTTSRFSPVLITKTLPGVVVAPSLQDITGLLGPRPGCMHRLRRRRSTAVPFLVETAVRTVRAGEKEAYPVNAVAWTGRL